MTSTQKEIPNGSTSGSGTYQPKLKSSLTSSICLNRILSSTMECNHVSSQLKLLRNLANSGSEVDLQSNILAIT